MVLLLVVFPQSACSFWPFAHMSAVSAMEEKDKQDKPSFDIDFGVNVLACSLPFSTILIMSIFSFSESFVNPIMLIILGGIMLGGSFIPYFIHKIKKIKESKTSFMFSNYGRLNTNSSSEDQ